MSQIEYQGLRQLDPQCEPEYTPVWEVYCHTCGHTTVHIVCSRPTTCPACDENELDALNIREVPE